MNITVPGYSQYEGAGLSVFTVPGVYIFFMEQDISGKSPVNILTRFYASGLPDEINPV